MADLTLLLDAIQRGEPDAAGALLAQVYAELRALARAKMAREQPGHTLQPTALVHEAWLKLGDQRFENRAHFFGAAAEAMRRILVDRARHKLAAKNGAGADHVDLDEIEIATPTEKDDELLAVHEALDALAAHEARKAELVKLRYFAGLTIEEAADVLGVSIPTAKRDWTYARAWLFRAMKQGDHSQFGERLKLVPAPALPFLDDCHSPVQTSSGLRLIMKLIPTGLLLLALLATAHSDEPTGAKLPVISLPVRVHLVQSETMKEMHTTLVEADIRRIFGKVNAVWAQAGIQFEIESIGPTQAIALKPELRTKSEFVQVKAMIPKERLSPTALDVCYVKQVRPNGFYYGEPIVVKDTASLKEVPGGLDEPLPRVTSHEIGHALGLQHRQETTNLMASGTTGFSLNETEIATARANAKARLDGGGSPGAPLSD